MSSESRKNSFDLIRFLAASFVVLSHSYALVKLAEPHIGNTTLGGFSVWVFFILSGYLISFSWKQYPRFNVFMSKRALRIFPGLIVMTILTIFIMGFLSSLSYFNYITSGQTITYLNNILLINTQYSLPGVFLDNSYPSAVNGSIWTLFYEFVMYLGVAILGVLSLIKKKKIIAVWGLFFILNIVLVLKPQLLSFSIFYLDMRLFAQMGIMFFSGVLLQVYEKNITYKLKYSLLVLAIFFIIAYKAPELTALLGATFLPYALIGIGKLPYFYKFGKYGDFSYGIYIYSFPIQQTISHFTQTQSPIKMFLLAWVLSIIAGGLSWHFVESRFIRMKKRIRHEDYPLSEKHLELSKAW